MYVIPHPAAAPVSVHLENDPRRAQAARRAQALLRHDRADGGPRLRRPEQANGAARRPGVHVRAAERRAARSVRARGVADERHGEAERRAAAAPAWQRSVQSRPAGAGGAALLQGHRHGGAVDVEVSVHQKKHTFQPGW